MKLKQTFRKQERLKSSKLIKLLFTSGKGFLVHPFKVNWQTRQAEGRYPAKVLISASKKHFRKAVERNHVKRLCKEAYRKNKQVLYDYLVEKNIGCDFSLVYIGREADPYTEIEEKIIAVLHRLISEIENNTK